MNPKTLSHLAAFLACLLSTASAWAQPVITSLNSDVLARSGRVAITGSGFGEDDGTVLVAGLPSWVSTWTETRIVAYVPEEAPLGPTSVVVVVGGQESNAVPLDVTLRQADGRIEWSFEIDTEQIFYRPAEAPDGTLFVHSYNPWEGGAGRVYAVSPGGALRWIQKVYGPAYVPPSAGPDGEVYVGTVNWLYRISAAGEIDWIFEGSTIQAAAAVGPDGTVYAGFEHPPEAVALDPATGELIWSNSPGLGAFGTGGNELRLGPSSPGGPIDRFYIYWDTLSGFSLDGDHLFSVSGDADLDHEVGVGSDGTLYAPGNFQSELFARSPLDGSLLWAADSPWRARVGDVEVGPDDTLYFRTDSSWIDAFDPRTQTSIWRHDTGHYIARPSLSPDGRILLTSGGGTCNDPAGCTISFVKAFDTTGGQELWHLELNDVWDPEFRHVTWDHARISADGTTAYFTGWIAGSYDWDDERGLLWAIRLREPGFFVDGFESGDTSGWSEVVP